MSRYARLAGDMISLAPCAAVAVRRVRAPVLDDRRRQQLGGGDFVPADHLLAVLLDDRLHALDECVGTAPA